MKIEVSNGEIFDKLSILKIKTERIRDEDRLLEVKKEHGHLLLLSKEIDFSLNSDEYKRLCEINEALWDIEEEIRYKETEQVYDEDFIQLSRNIYILNDERFRVKNAINLKTSSNFKEQKNHDTCYNI
jgi:hypothetical protein